MLFTYHKYQKSINSTVALDAHGNPVIDDQQDLSHELAEREWLNPGQDDADQVSVTIIRMPQRAYGRVLTGRLELCCFLRG